MGLSQSAPVDRHVMNIETHGWSEPVGYPVARPYSLWRSARLWLVRLGTVVLTFTMMNQRALALWPFLLVAGWLWMRGTVERVQSRGAVLDW